MPNLSYPWSDAYLATHFPYRPLSRKDPMLRGCDVYALQTALQEFVDVVADGIFGDETKRAVRGYQESRTQAGVIVDSVAGLQTMRDLGQRLATRAGQAHGCPPGIPQGHVEHECSYALGAYTPSYPDLSRDNGPVQENSRFTPPIDAFTTGTAIAACAARVRAYHDKYRGWGRSEAEAWRLGCGAWNAPAWTDRLAHGETLSASATEIINAYMDAVTAYADL